MDKISVCIGSACHLKGAYRVLDIFQKLVQENDCEVSVEVEGNFCQNRCTQGVVVKINEQILTNINVDNAEEIFRAYILRRIKK